MKLQHTHRQWVSVELADLVLVPVAVVSPETGEVRDGPHLAHYDRGEITVVWRDR